MFSPTRIPGEKNRRQRVPCRGKSRRGGSGKRSSPLWSATPRKRRAFPDFPEALPSSHNVRSLAILSAHHRPAPPRRQWASAAWSRQRITDNRVAIHGARRQPRSPSPWINALNFRHFPGLFNRNSRASATRPPGHSRNQQSSDHQPRSSRTFSAASSIPLERVIHHDYTSLALLESPIRFA